MNDSSPGALRHLAATCAPLLKLFRQPRLCGAVVVVALLSALLSFALTLQLQAAGVLLDFHGRHDSRFLIEPYPLPGPIRWECLSLAAKRAFTLQGRVSVLAAFRQDNATERPVWSASTIQAKVKQADARNPDVGRRLSPYSAQANHAMFQAFDRFPVQGRDVLVVGSITPWVEAICISYGANTITTVDFIPPIVQHSKIKTLSIAELEWGVQKYDAVISYSSVDHDGLGRYGDALNPDGDILRVQNLKRLLKPSGLLYLGVPTGPDYLVFNAHRIYGPIRFPLLIQGWNHLGTFGGGNLEDMFAGRFGDGVFCKLFGSPLRVVLGRWGAPALVTTENGTDYPAGTVFPLAEQVACYVQPVHVLSMKRAW